ncbi:MAG: SGNH/GDSL hydrolase family protein [Lachnospiraceae bacterium]|nr:SGNH/GDSL hydrolase family protein [Lachnospiraceae bacterium]
MKLDLEQIRSICLGAVRVTESESGVSLYRFTEEQEEIYRQANEDFYQKSFASAGMKLYFETDSRSLYLKVNVTPGSSRKYFSFDVMVDDRIVGYLDNFNDVSLPRDYTKVELPLGEFSKSFTLGEGIKRVCIYMPWSVAAEIRELSLDDNATIKPIRYSKKLLAFGDSITHGYDALRPSKRYASTLAEALLAEEINKGIGGEIFFPALAESRDDFEPDYITVAYGTNDWSKTGEEDFKKRCNSFYGALSRNYPNAKIFAITPIWRKDYLEEKEFGAFYKVAEDIKNIVKDYKNITCICGFEFIAQDENYFGDLRLHPNDAGFECYAKSLLEKISV